MKVLKFAAGSYRAGRSVVRLVLGLSMLTGLSTGCERPPDPRRSNFEITRDNLKAKYDPKTGRLKQMQVDRDRNGTFESVSFWDGAQLIRIEIDSNGDGVVDRWEHYEGKPAAVSKVGSSSRNDGVEDMWVFGDGGATITKMEYDADRDGQVDKWEEYDPPSTPGGAPILRRLGLDPQKTGQPTHWLHYDAHGEVERSENPK